MSSSNQKEADGFIKMESIDSVCVGVGTNSSLNDRPSAVCILFLHVSRMLCYLSCLARKSSSQIWKYCAALCVVPTMTWCFRFMRYRLTMHIHYSLMANIFSTHHMIPCVDTANWYPWQHNTWRKNSSSCRIFRRCTNSWNGTLVSVYSTYAGTYLALQTVSVFSFPRPRPYNPSSPSPPASHTHTIWLYCWDYLLLVLHILNLESIWQRLVCIWQYQRALPQCRLPPRGNVTRMVFLIYLIQTHPYIDAFRVCALSRAIA